MTPDSQYGDYVDFNPATSLLEYRFTSMQPLQGTGNFYAVSRLYTADSSSRVGHVYVNYFVVDDAITDSSFVNFHTTTGGNCDDTTVLQGDLADLVTWDMTSERVATINGTATADFTSCENYQEWVDLIESGSVTRIRTKYHVAAGDVTGEEVKIEYRVRMKGS